MFGNQNDMLEQCTLSTIGRKTKNITIPSSTKYPFLFIPRDIFIQIPYNPLIPSMTSPVLLLLLRLTLSTLLLHPLTPRRFARQLLDFAVSVALGVAVLARGFHRVDAAGFVR